MFLKDTKRLLKSLRKLERHTSSHHGLLIVRDLCYFCFVISIFMGIGYLIYEKCLNGTYNLGGLGDFIGGIIGTVLSFISIIILYSTLTLTNKQIKQQQRLGVKQEVESHFFELIKIHRENAAKLMKDNSKIFERYVTEIEKSYNDYSSPQGVLSKENLKKSDVIAISYLLFYYGNSSTSKETIKEVYKRFMEEYGESHIQPDKIFEATDRVMQILEIMNKMDGVTTQNIANKENHEILLGQYFRHLYQTVKYINEQSNYILSDSEKYSYIKTLRCQLSSYEQALLFWDSLSPLGYVWEMAEIKSAEAKNIQPNVNKMLITKYQLIKNIPPNMLSVIHPEQFYKDVKFDWIKRD